MRELFERVWPKLNVDDSSLRGHISALRKALGDGQSDARYVANVPGREYCFVAPASTNSENVSRSNGAESQRASKLPTLMTGVVGRGNDQVDLDATDFAAS
jgi:DNA-binding winged helix-turn-helix (wHTH) protein